MVLAAKPLNVILPVAEAHVVGLMDVAVIDGLDLIVTVPCAVF
jgi:hypothetical protein